MKKNPLLLVIVGVLLLAVGGFITFTSGPAKADAASIAKCEERMRDQGAEMLARCQEKTFSTAMTATDANAAAQAISASNTKEIGGNSLGMFLLGLGLVFTIFGVIAHRQGMRGEAR